MDLNQSNIEIETEKEAAKEIRLNRDFGADIDLLMAQVPDRMGFKIGEVSEMLGLKNHILRYWENEFPALKPQKAQNNQRMYTRKEIEKILLVRKLLYVDRFSISGAKRALRDWQKGASKSSRKSVNKERYLKLGAEIKMLIEKIRAVKSELL